MPGLIFTANNIIVGAASVYVEGVVTATAGPLLGNTTTTTVLNPITDAANFSKGDIIGNATNVGEKKQVTAIDLVTGTLTHEAFTAAANASLVTQLWRNLGATDGDIGVNGSTEMTGQKVDQTIYDVDVVATSGEFMMQIPLADISLRNLATAMGQAETDITLSAGVRTLKFNNPADVVKRAFLVTGQGPQGEVRSWKIYRGVAQAAFEAKHSKSNKQIINLQIKALFDDTNEAIGEVKQHATAYQY